MGSSASSELILFMGAIVAASALAGSGIAITADLADGYDARLQTRIQALDSSIAIINDPRNVTANPLELHVLNTGETWLYPTDFLVLIDGEVADDVTSTRDALGPDQFATLTIGNFTITSGDHLVQVNTLTGAKADFKFYGGSP